jgi:hypothetical protein
VNHNYNLAANIPGVIPVRQRRSASSIDPKVVLHDISQYEEFHQFQNSSNNKTPIKQEHRLLHRKSLDKSSDNDASLETLKDAASARKPTTSPMLHKQQPPLVIEEDEFRTDVHDYT